MLKHTVRFSELRMSEAADAAAGKPEYNAAGNLLWDLDGSRVEMSMLNGPMPRSVLRELLQFFLGKGVKRITADRAGGHKLPLAHRSPEGHYFMEVDELARRFMPAGDTDWAPYPEDPPAR